MTQTLKKMMLLAFVFAIASAAPKMTFKQAVSELDGKAREYLTLARGAKGAALPVSMIVLNRVVANNATGVEAVKNAVLGLKGTLSNYGSDVSNATETTRAGTFKAKFMAALVSPVVTGVKGTAGFAAGFVTDMNPFGSMMVESDAVKAATANNDYAAIMEVRTSADDVRAAAIQAATDKNDYAPIMNEAGDTEVTSADDVRAAAIQAATDKNDYAAIMGVKTSADDVKAAAIQAARQAVGGADFSKRMILHKQVAGEKAYKAGNVPANFSWAGARDGGRSLMAYLTIASSIYTLVNTARDLNDARLAKKAAAAKLAEVVATVVDVA